MIKKYIVSLFVATGIIFISSIIPVASVNASTFTVGSFIPICTSGSLSGSAVCGDVRKQEANNTNIFVRIIADAITIISFIVGVAAVILLIISGIQFATSGGDKNAAANAKRNIIGAVIGIVVVVLAQSIVVFVLDRVAK